MKMRQRLTPEILIFVFLVMDSVLQSWCAKNVLFKLPNKFKAGRPINVALTLTSDSPQVTAVRVSLVALNDATSEVVANETSMEPGETRLVKIQVPEFVPAAQQYSILVYSTSGEDYANFSKISLESTRSHTALVQTDRKMYKPGQKVLFRVIHLDGNRLPSKLPVKVTIVDPANIKVEMYRNVASKNGVSPLQFQLPDSTNTGKWSIKVEEEDRESEAFIITQHFTVEEYVDPTFEVQIEVNPSYIVENSRMTRPPIVVKAMYTFGKGVQGRCDLIIEQEGEKLFILLKEELGESGVVEFPSTVLSSIRATSDLILTAVVTDVTGRRENTSLVVGTFPSKEKIQFLKKTTMNIKPGLPAVVAIRLTDHQGIPLDTETALRLSVVQDNINPVEVSFTVPAGQTEVFINYTPKWKSPTSLSVMGNITVQLQQVPKVKVSTPIGLYSTQDRDEAVVVQMEQNSNLSVNSDVNFKVHHIQPKGVKNVTYSYMVLNEDNIVIAERLNGSSIKVPISSDLCPAAILHVFMAYNMLDQTWYEADQVKFRPTDCFPSQVKVRFDSDTSQSGVSTEMYIDVINVQGSKSDQDVYDIFYMAVDKRTTLLQGGTDLNDETLMSVSHENEWDKSVLLVGKFGKRRQTNHRSANALAGIEKSPAVVAKQPQVRRHFPDTWLWGQAKSGSSGKLVQTVKLPDSITSWEVSAFAVSEKGILTSRAPTSLTAFRRFFLTLNLPYSVKRSEVFLLKVTVFNYNDVKVEATVAIHESVEFMVFGSTSKDGWYETTITVDANSASTVQFRIGMVKTGLVKFQVKAFDPTRADYDEVLRNLIVEHDGVERIGITNKVMIMNQESEVISEIFDIPWPAQGISSGSERVEVKVTGEILGQALPNLDSLVVIPTGCGEQTMMKLAPNIFGLSYIKAKQLKDMESLVERMTSNMQSGYIRQVSKFLHADGSYSVWGPAASDDPERVGSTWLTAFVITCFCRAAEYITVDESVIERGMAFLDKRQASSGEFIERGKIIHNEFFKTKQAADVALTANVLISILEAPTQYRAQMHRVVNKAVTYLLRAADISELRHNKRVLASLGYVFSLTEIDENRMGLIDKILYTVHDDNPPWVDYDESATLGRGSQLDVTPTQLEVAAYVLLTYVRLGQLGDGFKLMRWLTNQQNHLGGFKSTKDTLKVLQALSEFGLAYSVFQGSAFVTVEGVAGPGSNESFKLDMSGPRSVLLQSVQISSKIEQVKVTLNAQRGIFAVVKVVHFYHEVSKSDGKWETQQETSLNITTESERLSRTVQKVKTCVQSVSQTGATLNSDADGMYVTTLFLPSGEVAFDPVTTIQADNPATSLVETSDGQIHFYLPDAPTTLKCLTARVERQFEFEVQKPGFARLYPYYNPDLMNETTIARHI